MVSACIVLAFCTGKFGRQARHGLGFLNYNYLYSTFILKENVRSLPDQRKVFSRNMKHS